MDSTLIVGEVIEFIADYAGHRAEVESITAAAMRGELDFTQSLHRRVALLEGVDAALLDRIGESLQLTAGARTLIETLQGHGVYCGIASGGFTQVCQYLVDDLRLDYCAANLLEVVDGTLTGRVLGDVVDGAGKARALRDFATRHDISLADTVVIGDGANDIEMARAAGLSIAFNAKPALREHCDVALDEPDLTAALALMTAFAAAPDARA